FFVAGADGMRDRHVTGVQTCALPIFRAEGPDALIIDEAEQLLDSLDDALGPGEGAAFLHEVLRACRRAGRFVLLTTPLPIPGWAPSGGERIVFPPADPHHAALAGISTEFSAP